MAQENDIPMDEYNPSWMEDGFGVQGEQPDYQDTDDQPWDTNAQTWNPQDNDQYAIPSGSDCLAAAGDPPAMGTYVLGSVDGVCQWIDTTTC